MEPLIDTPETLRMAAEGRHIEFDLSVLGENPYDPFALADDPSLSVGDTDTD